MGQLTKLYRYTRWGTKGEFPISGMVIKLLELPILRETPSKYVVREYGQWGKDKFVNKAGKKRFAYPTTDEAWRNWELRTKKCLEIQEKMLDETRAYLKEKKPE